MYERLKNINPRKTLGTVLVLCGWKLYFNMYHPMHTPPGKKNFLGFDDDGDDASSDDSDVDRASKEEVKVNLVSNKAGASNGNTITYRSQTLLMILG